jgi:hypothetical protein
MLRRFLIRLRFMPGARWVFDHLPGIFRWGWLFETMTLPPGDVYVPPGDASDGSATPRSAKWWVGRALLVLVVFGVGWLIGGVWTGCLALLVGAVVVLVRRLRNPPAD